MLVLVFDTETSGLPVKGAALSPEAWPYIVQFSFYKSWAFCIVQIIFAFFSNFSGVSL